MTGNSLLAQCQTTVYTLGVKISLKSLSLFMQKFKMPTKNGRKTLSGTRCQMTVHTFGVKYSIETTLSCTVFEINMFLCFVQKFKMATKTAGKTVFGKMCQITLGANTFLKITISHNVSAINALLLFMQNFKTAAKNCGKIIFVKKWQITLWAKNFVGITLYCGYCIVSEITALLCFKIAPKISGKMIFGIKCQTFQHLPWGVKIFLSKCLYFAPFQK